ncbi:hypothetical protein GCM10009789_50980 [Kribbella sancticallisti]|uniref:Uncharacterized protein n=1 Tax=Kribbella sancticallisti TaxID=460087 RepID=A0ABN2DYP8_9ACTN
MHAATAQYPSASTDPAEARRKISRAARRRVHARERRIRRTHRTLRAQLPAAW